MQLYSLTIKYLKEGKEVEEVFDNITDYQFVSDFFWFKRRAKLSEFEKGGKFWGGLDAPMIWIPAKDIISMSATGGQVFATRHDFFEQKKKML